MALLVNHVIHLTSRGMSQEPTGDIVAKLMKLQGKFAKPTSQYRSLFLSRFILDDVLTQSVGIEKSQITSAVRNLFSIACNLCFVRRRQCVQVLKYLDKLESQTAWIGRFHHQQVKAFASPSDWFSSKKKRRTVCLISWRAKVSSRGGSLGIFELSQIVRTTCH